MKKNAILLGAEVTVKVPYPGTADQIRGVISEVGSDQITITEKLSDSDEKAGKIARVMKVPKASPEVLVFHKNPNVPEAKVEDGVLIVNGETVRTGFEVAAVLITLPNRVYITAEPSVSAKDRVDVYSYNVAKDEFYKVNNQPLALDINNLTEIGTSVLIPYLNKHEEEEEKQKEDGSKEKVKYEVLEETGYLMISTTSTLASIVKTELGNSPIMDARPLGDTSAYFITTSKLKTENTSSLSYTSNTYNYDYDEEFDEDETDEYDDYSDDNYSTSSNGRIVPVDEGKIIIRAYKAEGRHLYPVGAIELDGEYVSAVIAGRTAVIKTTKAIHVDIAGRIYEITDKNALKDLYGFDYVVKDEQKNGAIKLWFTNKNAEIKIYSVTPSEDRGSIIDVL